MLKTIVRKFLKAPVGGGGKKQDFRSVDAFYPVSETCQIPCLADIFKVFLGERNNGVFVEVGAYDGEYASNTSCLADIGWNGLYIEPISSHYEKCVARHANNKNIKVIHTGISSTPGSQEMHSIGPLSTLDESSYKNLGNMEWAQEYAQRKDTEIVSLACLEDILMQEGISPDYDLLVVDVEGYEPEVFKSFSLENWMPKMIIVELHDVSVNYKKFHKPFRELYLSILEIGYVAVYKDFSNTIFIKKTEYQTNLE
ncbi:MAG: FkbM family methyltransferase [Desulfovibrio sp.]|jgi:FkbM family methyltransferase|nr:FkbM family methyltransferase [Desulfovibrio sp.]